MQVILTIDYSPWSNYNGGAQRSNHFIASALAKRGHDVSVINTKPIWEKVAIPENLPYKHYWSTFPDYKSRRQAPLRMYSAWFVANLVDKLIDPNAETVIHSNGEEGGRIHTLRKKHKFAFVSTQRHPRYPTIFYDNPSPSVLTKIRMALTEGKYLMQGSAARHADVCSPPSHFASQMVADAFHLDINKFEAVHNGVPAGFLEVKRKVPAGVGPLIFFGRFEPTKGVDTLIDALFLLGKTAPETHIIGRGANEAELKKRAQPLVDAGNVTFKGWKTQEELAVILSEAGAVALPSREENFSLANLSAMATGLPLISTKVGGTPEMIDDGVNGLLIDAGNVDQLATAIRRLYQNPEEAQKIGAAAKKQVEENFTWDVATSHFEKIYKRILATK